MNRLILLLGLLFVSFGTSLAQPRIAYILPDIGSNRFATYVEFIAPHDANGSFGTDGFYDNNPGSVVRIRPLRAADTAWIKVGPVVVSWNGRLASTLIFVTPQADPNSDDWTLLDPQWRIPVVVDANGQTSAADTFYIVKPFAFGDKRGSTQRIIGQGDLGKRSRRGAMMIDSAILAAGGTYVVSTTDTDPGTPGNQGYLPFTFISRGPIVGGTGAVTTELRVDAVGQDGGPGGGGGGGGVANATIGGTARGSRGGDGFTGGGPGGYNNLSVPLIQPSRQKPGDGSGQTQTANVNNTLGSRSLNGVVGGDATTAYENAGGGTGHPFGKSGRGCDNQANCNPIGEYGGASGGKLRLRGGGGGFGTDGSDEVGVNNGGRLHGNACLVPLAGGSGGASGNPETVGEVASAGGGGGGAISIHGSVLSEFTIYASGSSTQREDVSAGAGSGGGIIAGSRIDNSGPQYSFVAGQVPSQTATTFLSGGQGRARYDARAEVSPEYYTGVVTDTLTASLRRFRYTGAGNGEDIEIWAKPSGGRWTRLTTVSGYGAGRSWAVDLTLPGQDTLYYIMAQQKVSTPRSGAHDAEPSWVMSQSAWNILRIFGPPVIQSVADVDLGEHRCPGTVLRDTIVVRNTGESPLEISRAFFENGNGYRLVSPTVFPDTVPRFDSTIYIVEFAPLAGALGVVNDVLVLENNDTVRTRSPFRIRHTARVERIAMDFTWQSQKVDTIDLGLRCLGATVNENVTITNIGTLPMTVTSVNSGNPGVVDVSATVPAVVAVGHTTTFQLVGNIRRIGPVVLAIAVTNAECPFPDTLWVRLTAVDADLVATGVTQFGDVAVGSTSTTTIELRNNGTSVLDVPPSPLLPAPFAIVSSTPTLPAVLQPGESVFVTISYTPTRTGDDSATLLYTSRASAQSCPDSVVLVLAGRGVQGALTLDKSSLDYGDVVSCSQKRDSVVLTNTGTAPVTVRYPAFLNGPDAQAWSIFSQPSVDLELAPGQRAVYIVDYVGGAAPSGLRSATLTIRTTEGNNRQIDVPLQARHVDINIDAPDVVDLGVVAVGAATTQRVTFTNQTTSTVNVIAVRGTTVFTATPQTGTIAPNGTFDVDVRFAPQSEGLATATMWLIVDAPCSDSIPFVVRGIGETGSISAPNIVSFGNLSNCETRRDSITYVNTSRVAVDLIDVNLVGPDRDLFTIVNPAAATTLTLAPGERTTLYVDFDPRSSNDGTKNAAVNVRIRLNNQPVTFTTALVGERRTSLPSTPVTVVFGSVDIGSTVTQTVSIVNTASTAVRLSGLSLRGTSGGSITATSVPLPVTLAPGQRFDVTVSFTPTATGTVVDSVVLAFDQPCTDDRIIPVTGTGRLNVEVSILMPKAILDPTNDDVSLPIRSVVAVGTAQMADGLLDVTLRYRSSLFVAQSVTRGTIVRNEVVAGETFLGIRVTNVAASADTATVTEILGQATIGPIDSTDVTLTAATLTSSTLTPSVRPEHGWLRLEVCDDGGPRLITRAGSLSIRVTPNPSTDDAVIEASVFERGQHRVEVRSATGEVITTTSWSHSTGAAPRVIHLNGRELASGTYLVILETPTRRRTATFTIIH